MTLKEMRNNVYAKQSQINSLQSLWRQEEHTLTQDLRNQINAICQELRQKYDAERKRLEAEYQELRKAYLVERRKKVVAEFLREYKLTMETPMVYWVLGGDGNYHATDKRGVLEVFDWDKSVVTAGTPEHLDTGDLVVRTLKKNGQPGTQVTAAYDKYGVARKWYGEGWNPNTDKPLPKLEDDDEVVADA